MKGLSLSLQWRFWENNLEHFSVSQIDWIMHLSLPLQWGFWENHLEHFSVSQIDHTKSTWGCTFLGQSKPSQGREEHQQPRKYENKILAGFFWENSIGLNQRQNQAAEKHVKNHQKSRIYIIKWKNCKPLEMLTIL